MPWHIDLYGGGGFVKFKDRLFLDLLQGLQTRLTANSSRELLIENHRGILEYGEEYILLSASFGSLSIEGENLEAAALRRGQILIRGRIRSISFGGGNER